MQKWFPSLSSARDSSQILSYFIQSPFPVGFSGKWHHSAPPSWILCGLIRVGDRKSTFLVVGPLLFICGPWVWKQCQMQLHPASQPHHAHCRSSSRSRQHVFTHGIMGIRDLSRRRRKQGVPLFLLTKELDLSWTPTCRLLILMATIFQNRTGIHLPLLQIRKLTATQDKYTQTGQHLHGEVRLESLWFPNSWAIMKDDINW